MNAEDVAQVLTHGELEIEGRLVEASNTTLRCRVRLDAVDLSCVYKPRRGERPLWDFPDGTLGYREVATYLASAALGWEIVPITVWRDSGPVGSGMCQLWIDTVEHTVVDLVPPDEVPAGWRRIVEAEDYSGERVALVHSDDQGLRRLALLDVIVNNTDRKGGHILQDEAGVVRGVDHGLTFHAEDKLRTVLWGWADEPIPAEDSGAIAELRSRIESGLLDDWISTAEIRAALGRLDRLATSGVFPRPDGSWPPLPWPAF